MSYLSPRYKTSNWRSYNQALKKSGALTVWFDPDMVWNAKPSGKRGRQQVYSDAAIQTCLTLKVLFGLPLRQATGLMESQLALFGLSWSVPDFSTLSRRQNTLKVAITCVTADGAYDTRACHDAIAARGAVAAIPPRRNARLWKPKGTASKRGTTPCERPNVLAERFGRNGAGITVAAGLKRR